MAEITVRFSTGGCHQDLAIVAVVPTGEKVRPTLCGSYGRRQQDTCFSGTALPLVLTCF